MLNQNLTHNIEMQQVLRTAIEAVQELRKTITNTIETYQWKSDEYIENNGEQLEDMELDTLIIIKKLKMMEEVI